MSIERNRIYRGNQQPIRYSRVPPVGIVKSPQLVRGLGLLPGHGPIQATDKLLNNIVQQFNAFSATQVLGHGMVTRAVSVTTTPVQAIRATSLKGYLIINQSSALASGTTATGTLVPSATVVAGGNSQATSLGIANFRSGHLYLDISAVGGSGKMDFYVQTNDPASGNWCDAMLAFPDGDTDTQVGTYYSYLGPSGFAADIAMRWDLLSGTSVTFSIGYVLKEGLPGSQTGLSRTIFLGGNNGVTIDSGFPLLEGQSWAIYMEENTELWCVGNTALTLNVFELQ